MFYRAVAATCPGSEKEYNTHNIYLNSKYITEDIKSSEMVLKQKKEQEGLQFYAIAEGFGANTYADEASLIAIKKLSAIHQEVARDRLSDDYDEAADSLYSYLETFVSEAQEAVIAKAEEFPESNIHASFAGIAVFNNALITCNLGNTRIYLYRKGKLNLLSEEHNNAAVMFRNGIINEERLQNHPKRNKLTQYLGILPDDAQPEPYYSEAEIKHADIFVICSSTYCKNVSEDEICEIIKNSNSLSMITEKMMIAAAEYGISEDTSIMIIRADSHEKTVAPIAPIVETKGNANTASAEQTEETSLENNANKPRKQEKTDKTVVENVPFSLKLKRFLGLTEDSENEKIWPALLTFGCCILVVVLLAVLGWKIYDISKPEETQAPQTVMPTLIPDTTDTPSTNETETPTGDVSDATGTQAPQTQSPTSEPTVTPTQEATETEDIQPETQAPETQSPTQAPTTEPTNEPVETDKPTTKPTEEPTEAPTEEPTIAPTEEPTIEPTEAPTETPTEAPTEQPDDTTDGSNEDSGDDSTETGNDENVNENSSEIAE